MNDAESAPSPNRFCRRFGILKAAMNASAAIPVVAPRYRAMSDCLTSPSSREARMPEATRAEAAPVLRGCTGAAGSGLLIDANVVTRVPPPASRTRVDSRSRGRAHAAPLRPACGQAAGRRTAQETARNSALSPVALHSDTRRPKLSRHRASCRFPGVSRRRDIAAPRAEFDATGSDAALAETLVERGRHGR